ncbi:MAG: hypothetical protein E7Z64_06705 [Thermoplasmata archaeon]|nr:hypothetical protein [Thermoplasmata archaeon]
MQIDTSFDFTTDTIHFWDGFWEHKDGLGYCGNDPDSHSATLRRYHSILWSKVLPNGQMLELKEWYLPDYLRWGEHRFASDSITTGFRYAKCRELIDSVAASMDDYRSWMESVIRRTYTIGGSIIFPKHPQSINQMRGGSTRICDRWDLTLECIRRYYEGLDSPLRDALEKDRWFFDLFVDFKRYVDFFLLQDCVESDYSEVKMWLDTKLWEANPLPKNVDEYLHWIDCSLDFVEKRNRRIAESLSHR